MLRSRTHKRKQGFSLIELMLVVSVILVLTAISVPRLINTVNDISLRYAASDLSGLLQTARIQAVKKNTYYSLQTGATASGDTTYFLDIPKTGLYVNGDPMVPIRASVTVHQGTGSGAPNEASFIASLNFTVNPGADAPSFNARGLPCIAGVNSCPQTAGQGFVIFMSQPGAMGAVPWAAVVVNASGHTQEWTSDASGNWVQR